MLDDFATTVETVGERMEGVGHADKLRRSDGKVCFL
jgi:hypothetical protein